jgi:hypothetical protein
VANWTDWSIAGLRKGEWAALHISFGAVLLVSGIAHIVFNWRPLVNYFRNRKSRRLGFRPEWVVALGLGLFIFAGTKANLPPFASLVALGEEVKQSWDDPAIRAPIPHAELLTVAELAAEAEIDLETAEKRLRASGLEQFDSGTVIEDLAKESGMPAQSLYEIIVQTDRSAGPRRGQGGRGGGAGRGMGWMTLGDFCAEEGITLEEAQARLKARAFTAREDQTLREIAQANGISHPYEILEALRNPQ